MPGRARGLLYWGLCPPLEFVVQAFRTMDALTKSVVVGNDVGPMARLEAVVVDAGTPAVVFQRVSEGETLKGIAKAWGVPVGRFTQWYMTEHGELYDAALKVRADQDATETVEIADGASAEDVQTAKLRVDARKWRSGKWDRERYGEKTEVKHSGLVPTLVIMVKGEEVAVERVVSDVPASIPTELSEEGLI